MTQSTPDPRPAGEPERSLRYSILEGGAYTLMIAVTTSAIRTFFAASMGATDADFSLITALGTAGTMGAVVGSQLIGRIGSRRKLVMSVIWNRLFWAGVAALPFLPMAPRTGLTILMAVVLANSFFDTMLGNAWISWMTDLVPQERRSHYFGVRASIHAGIAMLASWGIGHAFDFLRDPGRLGESHVFAPLYLFAAVCGGISIHFMSRKWEPPLHGERPLPLHTAVRLPFTVPHFRRLLRFYALWTLVTLISTPFWQPHMIKNLQMDGASIAMYGILSVALGLVTQPAWGRLIDRFGCVPVLTICIVGVSTLPLFWLFARPDFLWAIWADAILTGLFWPGFNLASFSLNMQSAPRENRQTYIAAITVTTGLVGFGASLLGGWIATAAESFRVEFAGFTLVNYHLIFVLSTVGRIAVLPLARRLHEERAHPVRVVLAVATQRASTTLVEGVQYGVEMFRRITRP